MAVRDRGLVLRAFGDRVQVLTASGEAAYRPKGTLRQDGIVAGDRVQVEGEHVTSVETRRNRLGRPPVANVDILLAVVTLREPEVSASDLDRLLLQAEAEGLTSLVVVNKADLAESAEIDRFLGPYVQAGYPAVRTAVRQEGGTDALRAELPEGLAVLAGPSGVGKSSLLKALTGVAAEVGGMSHRLGRGRHTTRAATLYEMGRDRFLADTPGFSALDLPEVEPRALAGLYPDFPQAVCRFTDCLHRAEPDCGVREAARSGRLDPGRYARYLMFLAEIEGRPKKWH